MEDEDEDEDEDVSEEFDDLAFTSFALRRGYVFFCLHGKQRMLRALKPLLCAQWQGFGDGPRCFLPRPSDQSSASKQHAGSINCLWCL